LINPKSAIPDPQSKHSNIVKENKFSKMSLFGVSALKVVFKPYTKIPLYGLQTDNMEQNDCWIFDIRIE
jgi:hypothetical protein